MIEETVYARAVKDRPSFPGDDYNITLEDLAHAIQNRIGLPEDDAYRDANFVMDVFGFDDRAVDNVLDPEDRQLFYILEEEGLLTTQREETTLYDGREWRTHYWLFRKKSIRDASENHMTKRGRKRSPSEEELYRNLPDEAWSSRKL